VLIVASAATRETLERWTFEVETCVDVKGQRAAERRAAGGGGGSAAASAASARAALPDKPDREITAEIQAIIRQITASVTFLPLLEDPCTFDLLVYTKRQSPAAANANGDGEDGGAAAEEEAPPPGGLVPIPADWEESDARYVAPGCAADVRLRSFSTKVHKVDTAVTYRASDD
jgi:mitotic spindle assembly checkpoint protein MAD2